MVHWMRLMVLTSVAFSGATFASDVARAEPVGSGAPISKEARREATRYFNQGYDAQEREDYEAARIAFEKSYELWPRPDGLRNLGASQIQSGRLLQGARNLSRYLAEAPNLSQEEVEALQDLVREAEVQLGRIALRANVDGAAVVIDGEAAGVTPLQVPYHVSPGKHSVRAERTGHAPAEARVEARAGDVVEVELTLRPTVEPRGRQPAALPRQEAHTGSLVNRTTVSIALGVLAAGSVVFAYGSYRAGISAEDEARALRRRVPAGGCMERAMRSPWCDELRDETDRADRAYTYSKIGFAGALGFGIGSLGVLALWPGSAGSSQTGLSVSSWVEASANGLTVAGEF